MKKYIAWVVLFACLAAVTVAFGPIWRVMIIPIIIAGFAYLLLQGILWALKIIRESKNNDRIG
jgi:hypothetical protein